MKAYLGIKFHSDDSNKPRVDHLSSIIEKCGFSVSCIARDIEKWGQNAFTPAELMRETFQVIDACDVVIIDLTEKGVGLGIEAGYAYSKKIPIITIANKQEISTTLLGISNNHLVYGDESELFEFFKLALK